MGNRVPEKLRVEIATAVTRRRQYAWAMVLTLSVTC